MSCTYFTIPFDKVPTTPSYTVWFATWSTVRPTTVDPNGNPPFVVGCTNGTPPANSTVLGNSIKDPSPPPPPPLPAIDTSQYQTTLSSWIQLELGRGLD